VSRWPFALLAAAFLGGALLFGLAVHLSNPVLPDDDAYITYRYADNLLEGNGLVYNPGQRVFGSSTPLYVMWLAGLHGVARSVTTPELAVRVNFVFYALTIAGVFFLLSSLVGSRALVALLAGLLTLHPSLLETSLGGMETFLFTGLLVWSLWAQTTRRFRLGAWLAVLARPEGILLIALVTASSLAGRRDWRELVGLLLPGLAWVAFATPYFGTPIYHSLLAKSRPLYTVPAGSALATLASWIPAWTVGGWTLWPASVLTLWFLLLAFLLVVAGFGYAQKVRSGIPAGVSPSTEERTCQPRTELPRLRLLQRVKPVVDALNNALMVPMLLVLFIAFYAISNPLMFLWYFPPLFCLWFTALASGVVLAAAWLRNRARPVLASLSVVGLVALVGGPVLLSVRAWVADGRPATDLQLESIPGLARTVVYREAAEWLNHVAPAGDTLLSPEIGALGYYYSGYVFDACGLVSPEALPFLPVPDSERVGPAAGAIPLELVKHLQCDIIVTLQRFAWRSLYPSDWFHQSYGLVRQFKTPLRCFGIGGDTIDVFFRRGGRASTWREAGQ
jgi:hypothetical protein